MAAAVDVRDMLGRLRFTRDLPPGDLDRLAQAAVPIPWTAGTIIFREGDRDDLLYLVAAGRVGLDVSVPGRGRVRILTVEPGDVFGWSSVFYQKPKTALAEALEPTEALAFDTATLRDWSDTDPRFGYLLARKLLNVVSERLKATRLQVLDVFG